MTHSSSNSLLQKVILLREGIYANSCCFQRKCNAACAAKAECANLRPIYQVAKQLKILQKSREAVQQSGDSNESKGKVIATTTTAIVVTQYKDYKEPRSYTQQQPQQRFLCTENAAKANKAFCNEQRVWSTSACHKQRVVYPSKCDSERMLFLSMLAELHSIWRLYLCECVATLITFALLMLLRNVAHATGVRVASASTANTKMLACSLLLQCVKSFSGAESVVNSNVSKMHKTEYKASDKYSKLKQNQQYRAQAQCALNSR